MQISKKITSFRIMLRLQVDESSQLPAKSQQHPSQTRAVTTRYGPNPTRNFSKRLAGRQRTTSPIHPCPSRNPNPSSDQRYRVLRCRNFSTDWLGRLSIDASGRRKGEETWKGMGLSNWSWNGVPEAAADDEDASSFCPSTMPACLVSDLKG